MVMQSGAGHDAMMIANVIRDTGMIFAPSKEESATVLRNGQSGQTLRTV